MLTILGLRRRRLASLRGTATAAGSPIPVPAAAGLTARSAAAAPRPRPGLRMRVRGASSCGASTRQLGLAALRPIMISGLCRCRLRPRRRTLRFRRQWHLRRSAVFSTTPHVPRRHRRRRRAPQAPPRGVRRPASARPAGCRRARSSSGCSKEGQTGEGAGPLPPRLTRRPRPRCSPRLGIWRPSTGPSAPCPQARVPRRAFCVLLRGICLRKSLQVCKLSIQTCSRSLYSNNFFSIFTLVGHVLSQPFRVRPP